MIRLFALAAGLTGAGPEVVLRPLVAGPDIAATVVRGAVVQIAAGQRNSPEGGTDNKKFAHHRFSEFPCMLPQHVLYFLLSIYRARWNKGHQTLVNTYLRSNESGELSAVPTKD